jgi:hypothetical protein
MQYCDCGIHVYASVALAQRLGLVVLWVSCGHGRDETIGSWSRWVDRGATISANTCVSTCIINKIQGVVSLIAWTHLPYQDIMSGVQHKHPLLASQSPICNQLV